MIGVFFADGFEEIEALATVDILRRAGLETRMISVYDRKEVTGARKVTVKTDESLPGFSFESLRAIVLPGGAPGFSNLEKCTPLTDAVKKFAANPDKLVAAICGAPSILGHLGILKGKHATIYPGMEDHLEGALTSTDTVVTDGNLITSRGAGTAIDFALAIVGYYQGEEAAKDLASKIVYHV